MIQLPKERPPIKQISEVVWEISPDYKKDEPRMLVPARIYATKKLMEQMDMGIFEQISNVACLPGIQKAAMAMPDAHWGYGFPVGGVAAFDTETGIISPGGIGYDINCLTEDAKVLTEFGCNKQIKDFETEFVCAGKNTLQEQKLFRLASLNPMTKKIEVRQTVNAVSAALGGFHQRRPAQHAVSAGPANNRGNRNREQRERKPRVDWNGAQLEANTAEALNPAG